MNSIARLYLQLCAEKYVPQGFYKNGQTCARICNDVLQTFTLKTFRSGSMCTVEFGIIPLCEYIPCLSIGGYELDGFFISSLAQPGLWTFDAKLDASIASCASSIVQAIDDYLIPLFGKCVNCQTALPELIKLEELFDQNRQKTLRLTGETDCAPPWQELSLHDSRKYYMALKAQDYEYARKYLDFQLTHRDNGLRLQNKEQYAQQLEKLISGDFDYFDQMLQANESQTLELLRAKYPKL